MLLASNRTSGGTVNSPDPCIATWVNFANNTDATTFSPNVIAQGGNLLFNATVLAMSHGDEPDTPLYAPTMGPCFFPMGDPKVLLNGQPSIHIGVPSISNAGNAASGAETIPSAVNVFITLRRDGDDQGGGLRVGAPTDALVRLLVDRGDPGRGSLVDGAGIVRIDVFSRVENARVFGAVETLVKEGAEVLVVDLRGCPGGDLHAAVALAGDFLGGGVHVGTIVCDDGERTDLVTTGRALFALPVVVVVDEATASAAEVFAFALAASGRAALVGAATFGKTAVARVTTDAAGNVRVESVGRVTHALVPTA